MYITHDYVDEIKCIICGELLPYYTFNADHVCENCVQEED